MSVDGEKYVGGHCDVIFYVMYYDVIDRYRRRSVVINDAREKGNILKIFE